MSQGPTFGFQIDPVSIDPQRPRASKLPIPEHSMVCTRTSSTSGEHEMPAGSIGTVVHVYAGGLAYEVEFAEPFPTVLTYTAEQLSETEAGVLATR